MAFESVQSSVIYTGPKNPLYQNGPGLLIAYIQRCTDSWSVHHRELLGLSWFTKSRDVNIIEHIIARKDN